MSGVVMIVPVPLSSKERGGDLGQQCFILFRRVSTDTIVLKI